MTRAQETDPDISVSIVSYNTCDLLRACLQSLRARKDEGEVTVEVVVADNGSTDGSLSMVGEEFPWVRLVEADGNVGYGRANNLALAAARGRYFFVLNSDTEVQPGALSAMRDFLDARPGIGMAGAQLVLPDGSTQASCATDPSLLAVFWEQTHLARLFPSNRITGAYTMTHWAYDEAREVEQVAGACLFVRREAFRQIGGFDPAYFMYFEDTDLCIRMRKASWPIWFVPQARILHHLGASSQDWQSRARMIASYNRSRYYYFNRYGGPSQGRVLKSFALLGTGLRLLAWSLIALVRPAARTQTRIFLSVWRQTWRMKPDNKKVQE